ncbi:MAG: hypothetical protein II699_00040 [Lachnospiraceae bacterium]|nr:hypothetical protein [Lachnospiraceae bacterium]
MFKYYKRLAAFVLSIAVAFSFTGCSFIDEQWNVLKEERDLVASADAEDATTEEATTTTEVFKEQNELADFINADKDTLGGRIDTPNGYHRVNYVEPEDGEELEDATADTKEEPEVASDDAEGTSEEAAETKVAPRSNDLAAPLDIETFMRSLPVKEDGAKTMYYTTSPKENQDAHCAVLNLYLDGNNLQQFASSIMRLYAEYFWTNKDYANMKFMMVNGFTLDFDRWAKGERVTFNDNAAQWTAGSKVADDYDALNEYLAMYFAYSDRNVLLKSSDKIKIENVSVGDYFINTDSGALAMVVDVAENGEGDKCFLLAAGGNPGQDIEVLKNDAHENGDPWYYLSEIKDEVKTPEFTFKSRSLYHLHSEEASGDAVE